jgi:hypothetical protein
MIKLALVPFLLFAACLMAGLYGAVHNQISYTVSPEYFHAFKFRQFEIPAEHHDRLGAAIVGWEASWWMGFIIAVPLLIVGLIIPGWQNYLRCSLLAFAVAAGTALVFGLGALVFAILTIDTIDATHLPPYWYPESLKRPVTFAWAGSMHNASYLGGFLGIVTGLLSLIVVQSRAARRARMAAAGPRPADTVARTLQ